MLTLIGLFFLIFGGIYFMFWATYKIASWIPVLAIIAGLALTMDFILDHWILTLVIYTFFAAIAFLAVGDNHNESDK